MDGRDLALEFHQRHSRGRFGGEHGSARPAPADEQGVRPPLPFKRYPHAPHYRLPVHVPLQAGSPWPALTGSAATGSRPGAAELSALLYYGLGLTRWEPVHPWPLHRSIPSARCLTPFEVYVAPCRLIPPGLYHYDPSRHALVLVRPGDWVGALLAGAGLTAGDEDLWLLVTGAFSRTAHKYGDFAYRLCSHEAGIVIGNLLVAAAAFGWSAEVYYRFRCRQPHRILGLSGAEESLFAFIRLTPAAGAGPSPAAGGPGAAPDLATIPPPPFPPDPASFLAARWYPQLVELEAAAQSSGLPEPCPPWEPLPPPAEAGTTLPLPRGSWPPAIDLAAAWMRRNSGVTAHLAPLAGPIPLPVLSALLETALCPYTCDLAALCPHLGDRVGLYLVANMVEGLDPGVYRYVPGTHHLHPVHVGSIRRAVQRTYAQINVNLANVPAVLFPVGKMEAAVRSLGARGYRVLQMEAGLVAARISLAGAAVGLSVRCLDGVHEEHTSALLRLPPGVDPLISLPVFQDRLGVRYTSALRV